MSRNVIITIAAAATVVAATIASSSAYARAFGGSHFAGGGADHFTHRTTLPGGGHYTGGDTDRKRCHGDRKCNPRRRPPIWVWHHRHHWVFRGGRWIIDDVAVVTPVELPPAVTPAPCTCLTKTYTPAGLVVFADICTKESVSAPAMDDTADATKVPTTLVPATATPITQVPTTPNYAGRTYEDYVAANPQAAPPQAASGTLQQTPSAPQQN